MRPEHDIDHVAHVLFVGDAFDGFRWKRDPGAEVSGDFLEQTDAGLVFQFVAAQNRLQRHARFDGGNALAQARGQMGMGAERIEFAGQQLIQVRLADFRISHHDRIRRNISEPLGALAEQASHAAHQIEHGQHIDKAQQIADGDLAELQAQAQRD